MAKKDLSPDKLKELYTASDIYVKKTQGHVDVIRVELKRLNNPAVADGLKGGAGESIITTISLINKQVESIAEKVAGMRKFIDLKIEDLNKKIRVDHTGATETAAQVKARGGLIR